MYKQGVRPAAPTSVGPIAAGPLVPSDPSPQSIVSVRAAPLRGPSSLPASTGAIPFGAGDGELITGPIDAHGRSEAAYPIVVTFMARFSRPSEINGSPGSGRTVAIAKGQPLAFLCISNPDSLQAEAKAESERVKTFIRKSAGSARRREGQDQEQYVCYAGTHKLASEIAARLLCAVAAEPMVVRFRTDGDQFSDLTAVACCIEHQAPIFAHPLTSKDGIPAGSPVLVGVEEESEVKAYVGAPKELAQKCVKGFVPKRYGLCLVPVHASATAIPVQSTISAVPFHDY